MISIWIPGKPMAKQSVKFARIGNHVRAYQPTKVTNYQAYLKMTIANYMVAHKLRLIERGIPVCLEIIAYWEYPKSFSKKKRESTIWKVTRPDTDNISKPIKDAMNGIVYHDDSQVVYEKIQKLYSEETGIMIIIKEII